MITANMIVKSLLIKNGLVADCNGETRADVLIDNGLIAQVGRITEPPGGEFEVIDARGNAVMPAFVDLHCHLRDPGLTRKEDVASGCRAAAAGGYTTLVAMANTAPPCATLAAAGDVMRRGAELGLCDISQCVCFTENFDGRTLNHLDRLFAEDPGGQVGFVSDDGCGVASGAVFYEGLNKCADAGRTLLIHAEDREFSGVDAAAAEDLETLRDVYLIEKILAEKPAARAHFCHVSTRKSAEAIIAARRRGARITFEVTPHHIALNDGVKYRVNPPLRPESDRRFLIDCAKGGFAGAIATDHAPHTPADKAGGAPGMVGLETAFPVCYSVLVLENGLTLSALSNLMSRGPARIMGVNKGEIAPGFIGDIVIADINTRHAVDSARFYSKGRNTPFEGGEYRGAVLCTVKGGQIVYRSEGFN